MSGIYEILILLCVSLSLSIQVAQIVWNHKRDRSEVKAWEEEVENDIDEIHQLAKLEVKKPRNLKEDM